MLIKLLSSFRIEKLEPVPSEDAIKASTITTSNKGHPLSRFGFSSFSRSSNPNNRQSEEGARFGLSEGSIRTSSQMSLFPRWGASGGILWNERNNTATGASTRILRDDPTYVPRTQAPKHDILEEVTDKYRQKLESECNDGQQERRLSIRKPVTELLAPERIQFLNQAPSSSSSNKTSSGNTIIYSQPTSETCPEIMMGYLSQREQNNVLWKKYFVVLDSGSISIFKKKKLAPIQQPYGDEIVKSVTLKLFTVSLTDRSVTDYRGNQIPCNLYISPIITSIIKDELEEMVFRSNDMCGNESSLEEWADAFNSHILYNKMTNVVVSS